MVLTTRQATPDDARAIAIAHTRAWQKAYAGIIPAGFLAAIDIEERTKSWLQNLTETELPNGTPSPHNLVAVVSGHVVGFACVGVWRQDVEQTQAGEVWAIYVHPDSWGIGAGHELLRASVDLLADGGVKTAYLWVLEDNQLARRFYERQGWRADDKTMEDTIGGVAVAERRYSIQLHGDSSGRVD